MTTQRDLPILGNPNHQYRSFIPSLSVLSAVAIIAAGGGILLALPDGSDSQQQVTSTTADAPQPAAALDDSQCDKQAWPYIDQRCAQRVEQARGTRQVRVVTDKGNSVTVMTPVPVVEAKPKPAPQAPVVAQAERPIGPVAAPTVPEQAPQTEKIAAAAQQPVQPPSQNPAPQSAPAPAVQAAAAPANPPPAAAPVVTDAMARETPNAQGNVQNASMEPAAASAAPMAPGVEAMDEVRSKKAKSARAAEKREAKRRKAIEEEVGGVPEEAVTAVRSLPAGEQRSRRARNAVPDEVVAAVEAAVARDATGGGGRVVTVGSPNGGQRMYLVPSERW